MCINMCRYDYTRIYLDPVDEVDVAHLLVAGQPLHHLAGPSVEHGAPHLCGHGEYIYLEISFVSTQPHI